MSDYTIVDADNVLDAYDDTDVPGEFRSLSVALESEQLAVTLIRIPPHSDFEQGTGHFHTQLEEIYIITRGTLTMRFGEEIKIVTPGSVVRIKPTTPRSHRNESDELVEMWAISKHSDEDDSVKIDKFWEASDQAVQHL